jgi:CRISPR-associated protein, csm6 family
MAKTILFSPIGGTDPISEKNFYEGAMLHICRYYKPDKVVLYFSKEILEIHNMIGENSEDPFKFCLDELSKLQNRKKVEYERIDKLDLVNVQNFDYFYDDFDKIIKKLIDEVKDEDTTILLNVSSGTPAMKSGLLVLKTMGEYNCKLIQVSTPERKMNQHIHSENPDIKTLWELNMDNEENAKNRCEEVDCPSLLALKYEHIIKKLIANYDYAAALEIAENISAHSKRYIEFIRLAKNRLLLDFKEVDKIAKEINFDCIPIKAGDKRKLFEYALSVDIKVKRGEYADFVRSITPLIVELFKVVLKDRLKIDIEKYIDNKNDREEWSERKLRDKNDKCAEEVLNILEFKYNNNFNFKNVSSDNLLEIIVSKDTSNEKTLSDISQKLRSIESSVRNLAAHQIVSITDDSIKKVTQMAISAEGIMKLIKKLFAYTSFNIKEDMWNSYDAMNYEIIKRIDEK